MAYVSACLGGDVLHMIPDRMIILLARMDYGIVEYGIDVDYFVALGEQGHHEDILAGASA